MSKGKVIVCCGTLALVFAGSDAGAVSVSSFDPRSFGMGGVGVASGTSADAVFFNPALLAAAQEKEDFSLELPVLGARVSDPDDLIDAVDDFSDADPMAAFSTAIDNYSTTPSNGNATAVQASGNALIGQLKNLSDKALTAEGDVAFAVGVPGRSFGVAVFANAYVAGGTVGHVTDSDITAIQDVIDAVQTSQPVIDPTDSFTSDVSARFALLSEAGVAIAHRFDSLGGVAVGITPKYVQVKTYDYRFVGSEIAGARIDLDQGEQTDSGFNMDLGVAKDYGNGWKVGLAVRNILSEEYTTALNNKIRIEPMARVGVSRQNEWLTVAADLDLTENDVVGFESRTQYAAIGAEFNLWDTVQLRAGYRHNLSDVPSGVKTDTLAAGLGFSPFGVHIDLAVAGNSDEIGGAVQLGFRF
jgi:hypothetical protein